MPPDHIPLVVGPPITPDNTAEALFLQIEKSKPAFTLGALVNVIVRLSFTALQFPLLVDDNTMFTEPVAISVGVGKYVAVRSVLFEL